MQRSIASPVVDRIITWSLDRPLPALTRYLSATLLVVVAAVIRASFVTSLLPWLIFMPITLLIALTMGRRTGFYAVLLSALAAVLTIEHPGARYWLTDPQWVASLLYMLISSMIVVVGAELRAAFLRARRMSVEREQLALERETIIAERERALAMLVEKDAQAQLLNHELGHRLKNLLAIVQAVAGQTLRQAPDLKTANEALSFRLAAFGRAADVLTASTWESADLDTLARAALATHDSLADRFRLGGPPLRLTSQVALALALAFHELATNAIKYGALSNDSGHVELNWSIEPGPNPAEPRFCLTWQELGGPAVQPPARRGFGSLMIERSLRSYFRGQTLMSFEPGGLTFRIDAPLAGAQAEDGA